MPLLPSPDTLASTGSHPERIDRRGRRRLANLRSRREEERPQRWCWRRASVLAALLLAGLSPLAAPGWSAPGRPQSSPERCRNASTTLAMQDCLSAELKTLEQQLQRYLTAARQRLSAEAETPEGRRQAREALERSQQAWQQYRDSACQAVWLRWQGGTIRGPMVLECRLALSHERLRHLWAEFLTTMDGPPLLPDPGGQPGAR
ncbi:MAG: lysozyme inhibitor LprI family protein [Synechococcaceae cyanobacterium]|nr:lysozyme inhibitor LprI family protein [Synechococcaceae cyanobacterium]